MNDFLLKELPQAKWMVVSPGRVNLLGEYVDYNDGIVLPAAIDRYVSMDVAQRGDDVVHIRVLDLDDMVSFSID